MNIYNDHKVCNKCKHINPVESNFCIQCGEDIELVPIKVDTYTRKLESFIGRNSEFYLEKKIMMEENNGTFSWNWAAFLITPFWFLYRKLYGLGLGIIVLNIMFSNHQFSSNFISLLISIGAGIYSNALYLNHVKRQVEKLEELDDSSKCEFTRKKGGVSYVVPAVFAIVTYIIKFVLL